MKKFIVSALLMCATSSALLAQDANPFQIKSNITLGFQTGVQFNHCQNEYGAKTDNYQYTKRLLVRKKITHHFDMETGINYTVVPMGSTLINPLGKLRNRPGQLSIPLSLQYNFLPETSRLRPYIAAGGIYDIIKTSYPVKMATYTDGNVPAMQSGNRYGVVLAQGVIYEVNTKIQFNECIHFMQEGKCKTIGLDLGIGYKL